MATDPPYVIENGGHISIYTDSIRETYTVHRTRVDCFERAFAFDQPCGHGGKWNDGPQ